MELIKSKSKLDSEFLANAVIRLMKQDISERFKQTREVTDEDWEFCEQIDWHPVDELSPKAEHIKELKKALKEKTGKTYNSTKEFFNELNSSK